MIDFQDFQGLIAEGFFNGDVVIAGLIMYTAVLGLIFGLFRNTRTVLIISMPVTLIFSTLGILSTDLMILLIVVAVLALASKARDWS